MPGIVRSVDKYEDESMIDEIQNIFKEFLQNERCVILAVIEATVDFHNS